MTVIDDPPKIKSYWNSNGTHQDLYGKLWHKLVPKQNEAPTFHGEALRTASKLYYDHHNNASCNFDLPHFKKWRWDLWKLRTFLDVPRGNLKRFVSRRPYKPLEIDEKLSFDEVMDAVILWVEAQEARFPSRNA